MRTAGMDHFIGVSLATMLYSLRAALLCWAGYTLGSATHFWLLFVDAAAAVILRIIIS